MQTKSSHFNFYAPLEMSFCLFTICMTVTRIKNYNYLMLMNPKYIFAELVFEALHAWQQILY